MAGGEDGNNERKTQNEFENGTIIRFLKISNDIRWICCDVNIKSSIRGTLNLYLPDTAKTF